MKRKLFFALLVLFIVAFALTATACGEHTHVFDRKELTEEYKLSDATCTQKAVYYYSCECGEKGTQTFEYGDALGHSFTNYVSDDNATYDADGTKTAFCDYCGATDTKTDVGTKLEGKIEFTTLSVSGYKVYGKVSNSTETFSFVSEVKTYGSKTKFVVSRDAYGDNQIASNTVALDVGDNVFYLTEMNDDGTPKNVYQVTIRRKPIYNVSFNDANGTTIASQQVEEDALATKPTTNPTKLGYTFNGWNHKFSSAIVQDTVIAAKWNIVNYNIKYKSYGNEITTENPGTYTIEDAVTLSLPQVTKKGYTASWSDGGKIEQGSTGDKTFEVIWTPIEYTITYNLDDGTNNSNNPETYNVEDEIVLQNPTKQGYTFTGWENSYVIKKGTTGDLLFTASWSIIDYTITYNLNGGTNNSNNPATYTIEDSITLQTPSKVTYDSISSLNNGKYSVEQTQYTFLGWFTEESFENAITTISGTGAVVLYANWSENTTTTTTIQAYSRDGNYIYFGSYPQTMMTDDTIIASLNSLAGTLPTSSSSQKWTSYGYYISRRVSDYMWYIDVEYGGAKYRGVYFTSYRPCYCSYPSSQSTGYQYENGYYTSTVYWFKYEPIKWQILEESNGYATILADLALDSQPYYHNEFDRTINGSTVHSNNYAESDIRAWLNDTFYNTAFTDLQKALIQTVTVDNSASSTGYSSNSYACGNTSDKVWLLSYTEAFSKYSEYFTMRKKSSDYAKSQGCYQSTSSYYEGNCYWLLRSPDEDDNGTTCVDYVGGRAICVDGNGHYGVVPALKIKL